LVLIVGSIGFISDGYAYTFPNLRIQSSGNLSLVVLSLKAECYATQEVLICVQSLTLEVTL